MNCELCKKELDISLEGKLPEGISNQVEEHLKSCQECAVSYRSMIVANKVMDEEKAIEPNPFLVTRVMAEIEELEQKHEIRQRVPVYQKVLKPFLISVSIAAAVFAGVMTGNIYKPVEHSNEIPVELSYMNDAALESVDVLANQ